MAARFYSGRDVQYDPQRVRETLTELFGTEGTWIPISALVHGLMSADKQYPPPFPEVWLPLIDTKTWCAEDLRCRRRVRLRARIGRHARDHYTKWPSQPDELRAAYCVDKECDVDILGGARHALNAIGTQPANWIIRSFGAMDVLTFLSDLDFFIHYPAEDYIEEAGRAIIEAMAAGVPTILPPVFQQTFGDAAVYAEPKGVWSVSQSLWRDENAYLARAKAGRDFVLQNCGYGQLQKRLDALERQSTHSLAKVGALVAK
jgi:hypothetical protein